MKIAASVLAAFLAWTATSACAQWVWVDKDGRKVFSDRAPSAEIPEKDVLKRPAILRSAAKVAAEAAESAASAAAPAAAATAAKAPSADKELETKKKQAEQAEQARQQAELARLTAARVENCARAKQALVTLNSGAPMTQTDKSGAAEVMSDATRAAESRRIQSIINNDCR